MPHIVVKYSDNAPESINWSNILADLHAALAKHETITLSQIKTYAHPLNAYIVGDDTRPEGMIHIQLRLLRGRSDELRTAMGQSLHDAARAQTNTANWPCAISVETVELHNETYCSSYE